MITQHPSLPVFYPFSRSVKTPICKTPQSSCWNLYVRRGKSSFFPPVGSQIFAHYSLKPTAQEVSTFRPSISSTESLTGDILDIYRILRETLRNKQRSSSKIQSVMPKIVNGTMVKRTLSRSFQLLSCKQ